MNEHIALLSYTNFILGLCFDRVESYHRCIDDVDAALHYLDAAGHRDDHYLLLDRKAKCFQATNKPGDACDLFKKALDAAASSDSIPEMMRAAFKKQVNANIEKLGKRGDDCKFVNDDVDPMRAMYDICLNKKLAKHPSMSSKLAISYSTDRGRYVNMSWHS